MKILTVIGARPQFIKAAVISRALQIYHPDITEVIVHTGQHYDANMSDVFFDQLNIPRPNYNIGVGGGTHGQNTGRMLEKLEELMLSEKPDWVLVYGDTDSTLAGTLASVKLNIPVAHVEAGLRSFNRRMPEELNRIMTDHVSTLLFAPTKLAKNNLINEGIDQNKIHIVGDVMYDAALFYKKRSQKPNWFDKLNIRINEFILCTIHRAENTDEALIMKEILRGLGDSDHSVILPLHPRTRNKISNMKLTIPDNITIVDPVGYLEMVWLEENCKAIATDSGGVQKEAYFHKKPCVTLRNETEWIELVECGWNKLAGSNSMKISNYLQDDWTLCSEPLLYGNGHTAEEILKILVETN